MSWLSDRSGTPVASSFDGVFGLRPNLFEDYRRFVALLWERSGVDPTLLELCRLRVAELHGCRSALAERTPAAREAGLGEAKIARLSRHASDPAYSDTERACLAFAERFVADPRSISDADAAAVVEHLGEARAIGLIEALAIFDGFSRFRLLLGIDAADDRSTA